MHESHTRIRLAQRLHDAWRQGRKQRENFDFLWGNASRTWSNLLALKRQLQFAFERGFQHCLPSLDEDFRWKLEELTRSLQSLRDLRTTTACEPSLTDWMNELQALDEEFGSPTIDDKRSVLSVETEPITLRGVELGRFALEFHWRRQDHQRGVQCFDIVPLDANTATGRDDVSHPHVNDTDLCAGDAGTPIEAALREGRISEAFILIRSVLTNYNPRSAYVQLDEWDGVSCSDCGGRVRRENASFCSGCDTDLCDGCSSMCRSCEETRCGGCLTSCNGCSDLCCSRCLESINSSTSLCPSCRDQCSRCHETGLKSDLDEQGLCPDCAAAEESPPTTPAETTHAS